MPTDKMQTCSLTPHVRASFRDGRSACFQSLVQPLKEPVSSRPTTAVRLRALADSISQSGKLEFTKFIISEASCWNCQRPRISHRCANSATIVQLHDFGSCTVTLVSFSRNDRIGRRLKAVPSFCRSVEGITVRPEGSIPSHPHPSAACLGRIYTRK